MRPKIQWWTNAGPDNAHWMHHCTQWDTLAQAKAEAEKIAEKHPTWVWAIIRGEDLPFEPGSRTMHSASSTITATYVHMWVSVLPGNKQ